MAEPVKCRIYGSNAELKLPLETSTTCPMLKTVLIIEDDPDILDMMSYILRDEGYSVVASRDCSPLETVLELAPDLILMDNRLPDVSGKDACRKLKQAAETRHIPVLLISANQHLPQLAEESLADGYVSKPFDLEELISAVRQYTGG
jgi:CheY-like chemotaxis protein